MDIDSTGHMRVVDSEMGPCRRSCWSQAIQRENQIRVMISLSSSGLPARVGQPDAGAHPLRLIILEEVEEGDIMTKNSVLCHHLLVTRMAWASLVTGTVAARHPRHDRTDIMIQGGPAGVSSESEMTCRDDMFSHNHSD
jgi:hypothetical protein